MILTVEEQVAEYEETYGDFGKIVLEAFVSNDPLDRIAKGNDPRTAYLHEARKFFAKKELQPHAKVIDWVYESFPYVHFNEGQSRMGPVIGAVHHIKTHTSWK